MCVPGAISPGPDGWHAVFGPEGQVGCYLDLMGRHGWTWQNWVGPFQALYFLGIIDILTPYDGRKHLEHWFKARPSFSNSSVSPAMAQALRYDSKGVSCCPPAMYSERFNQFMKNAIA